MTRILCSQDIITNFYKRILVDTDPEHKEFTDAFSFEMLGYEFHVQNSVDFWLDAMGAGPRYEGSIKWRTHGFHKIHSNVMTQKVGTPHGFMKHVDAGVVI